MKIARYWVGKERWLAHTQAMARWLKITLIVSALFAGWVALGALTFDDSIKIDYGR